MSKGSRSTVCHSDPSSVSTAAGLFAVAESIDGLTRVIQDIARAMTTPEVGDALAGIAELRNLTVRIERES